MLAILAEKDLKVMSYQPDRRGPLSDWVPHRLIGCILVMSELLY
jgi:hypothetical protein